MNRAQVFSLAEIDAMLTNGGLPAYTDLLETLRQVKELLAKGTHLSGSAEAFEKYREVRDAVEDIFSVVTI